jgi:WhiB family redox-sensing transcriptional regulator
VTLTYVSVTPSWHAEAACRGRNPELFFPENRKTLAEEVKAAAAAKRVCARCPVVSACLEAAFANGDVFGVFGGSTPAERERVADREDRVDVLLAELHRQVGRVAHSGSHFGSHSPRPDPSRSVRLRPGLVP